MKYINNHYESKRSSPKHVVFREVLLKIKIEQQVFGENYNESTEKRYKNDKDIAMKIWNGFHLRV